MTDEMLATYGTQITTLEHENVDLDPASPGGFSRVDCSLGALVVSLESVEPYLDGVRGDEDRQPPKRGLPRGFKIKAVRSIRLAQNNFSAWYKARRTKEFSFTTVLSAGTWNRVALIFEDTPAKDFGYLNVAITTDLIALGAR
jgi:hypothetical protein